MWITNQLGVATWRDAGTEWKIDAEGGNAIRLRNATEASLASTVRLSPVDDALLPAADEQFIRGRSWNVNYPQASHRHALRIAFEPIDTTPHSFLIEPTISIQTDLLDAHPKIDIQIDGNSVKILDMPGGNDRAVNRTGSAAITIVRSDTMYAAVFLGPHDSPFTTDLSTSDSLKLRLFGEFLEKGVIRKARPWILIDHSEKEPSESELQTIWTQLANRPLPLAS
jgi:hypothetical protein